MSRRNAAVVPKPAKELSNNDIHIASLQSKARDIEQRLAVALSSSSSKPNDATSQKNINRYRMLLCELYADWILSDPLSASVHAVGPLWRSCFYGRIGPARTRLQKEQRALEKRKHENNTEALQASIKQQTESLQVFLSEGITLYEYLCDKLQYELLQEQPNNHNDPSGRVPCLYRLYISLGDLYRYGSQYPPAIKSYHIAALLGPGQGHAYNQLAVMDQMQEQPQTAVTVYWYARSLAAAHEPFATATANLIRLWEQNRAGLSRLPSSMISGASSTNSSKSKASQAASSRHCLAQFVDVHYRLFQLSQQQPQPSSDDVTAVLSPLSDCVDAFGALLLQHSAWGDHLLAKLVTMLAFSEYQCAAHSERHCCAGILTYEMGQALGERVGQILAAKQQQSSPPSSIRVLGPLLLLTEYLLHRPAPPDPPDAVSSPVLERYRTARSAFWKRLVHLYNGILETGWATCSDDEPVEILEYQEWRGFAPFAPFVHRSASEPLVDGFLSDRATAQLLQLSSSSDAAESASLRSSGGGSQSWSLRSATTTNTTSVSMKLRRFLSLRPLFLSSPAVGGHIRSALRASSQWLEWVDVASVHPAGMEDGEDMVPMDDDDDDGGDVILPPPLDLVYQPNPAGGPALLVPAWSAAPAAAAVPPSLWGEAAAGVAPPPGFVAAPQGWSPAALLDAPSTSSASDLRLGESMLWLGGPAALQTTNPFVRLSDLNAGDRMMEDHHGLSAGLLRSLLMGETTTGAVTKNPFA
jgi:Est1 DNA/RNA binding domain